MKIGYSRRFLKELRKASLKIQLAFKDRLDLFIRDRHAPVLNDHQLSGNLRMYRSINVSGDWRAIYRTFENGKIILFIILGTHSRLYK